MFNRKDEKISGEKVNEVLGLTKKILKIVYIFMFLIGIYSIMLIFKELKLINFILSLIKTLSPLFIGIIIAWLFEPLVTKLQSKKINRVVGSILVYIGLIAVLYVILWALLPLILDQVNDLVASIPKVISSVQKWLNNALDNDAFSFINVDELLISISEFGTKLSINLPIQAVNIVKNVFSSLGTFAFGLMIGFYLLFSFNNFGATMLSFVPQRFRKEVSDVGGKVNNSLRNYVMGISILASLIFVVCSVGFSIAGLKAPLLFGFICGITDLIPYVGPWIGGAIAVIVGLSSGLDIGIFTLIVVCIGQVLESFVLQPVIMSKTMKLHPVTIIVGLLVFEHFFGIIGMVVATPVLACFKIVFNYLDNKFHFFNKSDEVVVEAKE